MFRRMVTQGIGAMERGEDPKGIVREFKGTIPTYANETLINAPGNASPGELKDAAKRVYQQMLAQPVSSGPNPECT
jgi:hypothetical protein